MSNVELVVHLPGVEWPDDEVGLLEVSPLEFLEIDRVVVLEEPSILHTAVRRTIHHQIGPVGPRTRAAFARSLSKSLTRHDQCVAATETLEVGELLAQTQNLLGVEDR